MQANFDKLQSKLDDMMDDTFMVGAEAILLLWDAGDRAYGVLKRLWKL